MRAQALWQVESPHLVGVVLGGYVTRLVDDAQVAIYIYRLSRVLDERLHDLVARALVAIAHEFLNTLLFCREVVLVQTRSTQFFLDARLEGCRALGEDR